MFAPQRLHIGGHELPAVGLGLGLPDHKQATTPYSALGAAIKIALARGIKLFDTAPVYGQGASEQCLGEILPQYRRHDVFIATKVAPEELTAPQLKASVDASLNRLNCDHIDLLQVHWFNPQVDLEETLGAMHDLVQTGKVVHIGLCNFNLDQIKRAHAILGDNALASVQAEYNLVERSPEQSILPYCWEHDIAFIAYSPLRQGDLARSQSQFLVELAGKYEVTVAQLVLSWIISHSNVFVIPNTTRSMRVLENAGASNVPLTAEDKLLIDETFAVKVEPVAVDEIHVSAEQNRKVYQNLDDALQNSLQLCPSPAELAQEIKQGDFLKPVRLKRHYRRKEQTQYDLIEGRLRYWAWVIAHGQDKPIPALIAED